MLKGHITLSGKRLTLTGSEGFSQKSQPNLMSTGYRDFVQVLAISLAQVPADRRINFEVLALASQAILSQNTSDHAICQLCLPFPITPKFGKRSYNPFKIKVIFSCLIKISLVPT